MATLFVTSLILIAGLFPYFISDSDSIRGLFVAVTCIPALIYAVCRYMFEGRKLTARVDTLLCILAPLIVGSLGLLFAVNNHNNQYYIAADLFHWFFEVVAVAMVFRLLLANKTAPQVADTIVWLGVVLTGVGVIGVLGAYAGVFQHGGHFQGGGWLWHIKAGLNYPEVMLIFTLAVFFRSEGTSRLTRQIALIVSCILGVMMIMTLKRTMWLSFGITIWFLFLRRRHTAMMFSMGANLVVPLVTLAILYGSSWFEPLNVLTYNPNYQVTDSILDRTNQLSDIAEEWNWVAGHGFGAEYWMHEPATDETAELHYVHSLYFYYLLQLGGICFAVIVATWVYLQYQLAAKWEWASEWTWLLAAALASHVAIQLNGLTLLSVHSVYTGFVFGLGHLAVSKAIEARRYG